MFLFNAKNHFNLANLFTFGNIASGIIALYFITESQFHIAVAFAWLGGFLDIFDGKIARKYKLSGEFGIQLDSFADFLSFVLIPTILLYFAVFKQTEMQSNLLNLTITGAVFIFYVISGLRRLINFNIEMSQKESSNSVAKYFIGIPTPLGAILLWFGFLSWDFELITEPFLILFWITLIGYLLNSKVKIPHP
jgi:CDP-diacylglycerol--serine O-phosphatidyltransferase